MTSSRVLKQLAKTYVGALGVTLPIKYEWSWDCPGHGVFVVETGSRGGKRYTIGIRPDLWVKRRTLLRTLAHEVYHAWEEQEGVKTSERAAERWARQMTGGL